MMVMIMYDDDDAYDDAHDAYDDDDAGAVDDAYDDVAIADRIDLFRRSHCALAWLCASEGERCVSNNRT